MTHTPWTEGPYRLVANGVGVAGKKGSGVILRATERFMCRSEREANAKRAYDCMNGCTGLNPAAYREVVESLSDFLENSDYQVAVGGNPIMVDRMIERASAALAKARAV